MDLSRNIDLTASSPAPVSNQNDLVASKPPVTTVSRRPLKTVQNGARVPIHPEMLLQATLKTLSAGRILKELQAICVEHPDTKSTLQQRLLVKGKDVVRYHADTESEDEIEGGEDEDEHDEETKSVRAISIGDENLASRYAKCEHCKEEFDVTTNEKRDCHWHTGSKEFNDDDDFWADHDENCHGRIDDLVDEPDYAEGFAWSCCNRPGDDEGCKVTKHKAKVNVPIKDASAAPSKKRKAKGELSHPKDPKFRRRSQKRRQR